MLGKKKSLVGLDIGSTEVKAVELTEVGDEVKITGFGHGTIESPDAVQDTIADVLRSSGIKTKRVATAVSGRAVIVRYLNMVRMPEADVKNAIRYEADKYIPFQVDEVILDSMVLPDFVDGPDGPDPDSEMRVLLVAVKQNLVDEHLQVVQGLGLTPAVIDVDTFALGNAFELNVLNSPRVEDEDKVVALVDIGSIKTNINILKNNTSYFSREIYLAGNEFSEAIARRLGIEVNEAAQLKQTPDGNEHTIEESILPILDDLGNEIHLSFDYYENQYDREIDEVYLSGGSSQLPGLREALERTFDRALAGWDPTENLEVNDDRVDIDVMKSHAPQLAIAVGLASRILDS